MYQAGQRGAVTIARQTWPDVGADYQSGEAAHEKRTKTRCA